jgi:hypothetical protein
MMATEDARIAALSKLDQIIRDPRSRQEFLDDPHETLRNTGAEPGDVPPNVWQALTDMTLVELAAIARLGTALTDDRCLEGDLVWKIVV